MSNSKAAAKIEKPPAPKYQGIEAKVGMPVEYYRTGCVSDGPRFGTITETFDDGQVKVCYFTPSGGTLTATRAIHHLDSEWAQQNPVSLKQKGGWRYHDWFAELVSCGA